jgi:hypothetical protein
MSDTEEEKGIPEIVDIMISMFPEAPEDATYEGQSWEERVEGWILHAFDRLMDDLDNPDLPEDED